jgi:ABC-2 type transport system ATP-binding protein
MSEYIIDVQNLTIEYKPFCGKKVRAVDNLSFKIGPGEVVGFLGPNGAGKSTTLRTLMGFQHAKSGIATVFGFPAGSVEAKRRVGFLPEVALYYPFLTVTEVLTMYGQLQGLPGTMLRIEVKELIERVGLKDKATTLCKSLSKGMLQRVGIAQAVLGNPEILILDEVTSGLDPVGRRDLRELLQEKQRSGTTIFFSSHELTEVEMLCDRIILINKGKLVEERTIGDIREKLQKLYLKFRPVNQVEEMNAEWSIIDGECHASFLSKADQLKALERIQQEGCLITDMGIEEVSLEDYFVDTISGRAA